MCKKPLKRFLWPIIILSIAMILAACAPEAPNAPTPSATPTQAAGNPSRPSATPASSPATPTETPEPLSTIDVQPSDLQGVRIRFWHVWTGEMGALVDSQVEAFNAQNEWGITVAAEYQGNLDELDARMVQALEENDLPNIAVAYNYQALAWDGSDLIVNLESFVQDPVWGLTLAEQEDFYPAFWEADVIDGRRVGIPAQRSGQALFYNQSWAEELGFRTPPLAPLQFERQACAAAQEKRQDDDVRNDGTGGYIVEPGYPATLSWIYTFDGRVVDVQRRAYRFDTPETRAAFTFLRELADAGCAWQTEAHLPTTDFAARRGLFAVDSVAGIEDVRRAFEQAGRDDRWTVIPFPSGDGSTPVSVFGPSYILLEGTPQENLAAWLFIRWMVAPENLARQVEAGGLLPLRVSTLTYLESYTRAHPEWRRVVDFLPDARPEPGFASWKTVRWAVEDASTQLFRYYFTLEQVPDLTELLDETANDLHSTDAP